MFGSDKYHIICARTFVLEFMYYINFQNSDFDAIYSPLPYIIGHFHVHVIFIPFDEH